MNNKFEQFLKYDFQKAFDNPSNGLDEDCWENVFGLKTLGIMFDFSPDLGVCVEIQHEGFHRHIQFIFKNKDNKDVNVVFSRSCVPDDWAGEEEFNCDDPSSESSYFSENHHNIPSSTLDYLGITQEEINTLDEIKNNLINFVKERNENVEVEDSY